MNRLQKFEALLRERSGGRKRANLREEIWPSFNSVYGELRDGRHPRSLLAEVLDELKSDGIVSFPKGRTLFDREASPSLPVWIEFVAEQDEAALGFDHRLYPWHPSLAWIADLAALRQVVPLQAIDAFLKGPARNAPIVPHRERSLQILGDEKALDRILVSNLCAPGRLSLELLRCQRLSPPFLHVRSEAAINTLPAKLLIIENHNTWHSFAQWNRGSGQYRAIVYGGGMQFEASVSGIDELAEELGADQLLYFGDLDPKGLAIPARANVWQRTRGIRPIAPAHALYQALLQTAQLANHPATGRDKLNENHLEWLPKDLHAPVRLMLNQGRRIPQEYIGTEWLLSHEAP
jgi:hypothetical protein